MARFLDALGRLNDRHEHRMRRRLPQVIAGLLAVAIVAANPPSAGAGSAVAASATRSGSRALADSSSVFLGSRLPGRAGVEASARAMVASTGGLTVAPGDLGPWIRAGNALVGTGSCPPSDVTVTWVPPLGTYQRGAYVEPLGPVPTSTTTLVNGVVLCRSSTYAYVGFEAAYLGGRWRVAAVPGLGDETGAPLLAGEADAIGATPAESGGADGEARVLPPAAEWAGSALEALAAHTPQTTCDPTAKRGVLGFRDLLLETFPGSRNLGIGRACEAEGVSEHKEGRAFDWGVSADDPVELAAAETQLAWMLGPDETGELFAIARRLGLMYVIWDEQIWSSFRASDGWRPYVGVNSHRDHIHFSFDWAGALAETSFWKGGRARRAGSQAPDLPLAPVAPRPAGLPLGLILPPPPVPALPSAPGAPPLPLGGTSGPADPEPTSDNRTNSGTNEPAPTTTTTSTTTTTTAPPPSSTTTTTTAPVVTLPPPPSGPLGF